MQIFKDFAGLDGELASHRKQNKKIAFVPTMGAIHAGHQALMEYAKQHADIVVASIFVNPKQFGPNEDLERYPRPIEQDKKLLSQCGVDCLLLPEPDTIYPRGTENHTVISVPHLSEILCGAKRVNLFDGVCTVVLKLLLGVRPQLLILGQKDYQQFFIVRRMVEDFNVAVEVISVPTVRESDGLALSSRNAYLSADERKQAPALYQSLLEGQQRWEAGERDVDSLAESICNTLKQKVSSLEYWSVCDLNTLTPLRGKIEQNQRSVVICACVSIGNTRLIDNVICGNIATG